MLNSLNYSRAELAVVVRERLFMNLSCPRTPANHENDRRLRNGGKNLLQSGIIPQSPWGKMDHFLGNNPG